MDGYHLTRAQLSAMPDPETAHARRGAEFTFDGEGFLGFVQTLRQPVTTSAGTIYAPSFDHAVKDPKENDIAILPSHRIIVFEGNCELTNSIQFVFKVFILVLGEMRVNVINNASHRCLILCLSNSKI